jgi:hypothetical protein
MRINLALPSGSKGVNVRDLFSVPVVRASLETKCEGNEIANFLQNAELGSCGVDGFVLSVACGGQGLCPTLSRNHAVGGF